MLQSPTFTVCPVLIGRQVFCGLRQSIPSRGYPIWPEEIASFPSATEDRRNVPRSRRFVNRQAPWPSCHLQTIAFAHPGKESMTTERIAAQHLPDLKPKPVEPLSHIGVTGCQTNLHDNQCRDHDRRLVRLRATFTTKSASEPRPSQIRKPSASAISTRPSVPMISCSQSETLSGRAATTSSEECQARDTGTTETPTTPTSPRYRLDVRASGRAIAFECHSVWQPPSRCRQKTPL